MEFTLRKIIPLILCTALAVFAQPVAGQHKQQSTMLLQQKQWDCQCKLVPPPPPEKTEAEKRLEALNSKTMNVYKDARGTILSMSDILFETGQANLKQEAKDNLTEVAAILKTLLSDSNVEIEGHSDSLGNAANNERLSQQRADAVLNHLVSRNVESTRLKAKGYGSAKPIAANATPEGRAKNRRVELVIEAEEIPELPEQTMRVALPIAAPVAVAQPIPQEPVQNQLQHTRHGLLARVNINSFSSGNSNYDDYVNSGLGFGVGYTIAYPFSNFGISLPLSLNPEALFYYRKIFNLSESEDGDTHEENATEFAISLPVMIQYKPIAGQPFHVAAGLQFDIPFMSEIECSRTYANGESEDKTSDIDERATVDIGFALGIGYRITEKIAVDFRMVIGLSALTRESGDKSSLNQYGIGVTYWGF